LKKYLVLNERKGWEKPFATTTQEDIIKMIHLWLCEYQRRAVPDLPIGNIGLSLGPQDPRGPPTNCGTH